MLNRNRIFGGVGLLAILGAIIFGNTQGSSRRLAQRVYHPYSVRVEQNGTNAYPETCPVPAEVDLRVVPVPKADPDVYEPVMELPHTIPGTNRVDPEYAKKNNIPEDFIVKPHPYDEGKFLIVPDYRPKSTNEVDKLDTSGWRASSDENYKFSMKVINPDGSVHYEIQIRDKDGKIVNEHCELSNERYEINPNFRKPQFYSTTPVIKNPDGSVDFYRPLGPNKGLEDARKKGPDQRFVPRCSNIVPIVATRYVYEFKSPVYIGDKEQVVSPDSPGARLVYPNGVNQYTDKIKPGDKIIRVESEVGGPYGPSLIYYLEKRK